MPNNRNHMICKLSFHCFHLYFTEFNCASLDSRQDPGEHPGVELEVVEWPEQGQGVEQGAAHHHDQVVDRHHLELRMSQNKIKAIQLVQCYSNAVKYQRISGNID